MTTKDKTHPLDANTLEHIDFFKSFIEAVRANRHARLSYTKTGLKLHIGRHLDCDPVDQRRLN